MKLLGLVVEILVVGLVAMILITWIWVFYHRIKCRKVETCTNRKCKYFDWCEHNQPERKRKEMELRKEIISEKMLQSDKYEVKDSDVRNIDVEKTPPA